MNVTVGNKLMLLFVRFYETDDTYEMPRVLLSEKNRANTYVIEYARKCIPVQNLVIFH